MAQEVERKEQKIDGRGEVETLAKSVYLLIQKLLRLTIPGYLKDNSVFSYLLSECVVCVVSRLSTT